MSKREESLRRELRKLRRALAEERAAARALRERSEIRNLPKPRRR